MWTPLVIGQLFLVRLMGLVALLLMACSVLCSISVLDLFRWASRLLVALRLLTGALDRISSGLVLTVCATWNMSALATLLFD